VIDAARYYTFFPLDVSDILNYDALAGTSDAAAKACLADNVRDSKQRRSVVAYHRKGRRIGGQNYRPDEATIGRMVGKYWAALRAVQELNDHISSLKNGTPYDLELGIDENPPEVSTFDCLTADTELTFVLLEIQRRKIPLTHIAPNLGVEKGVDYRCPDGLVGLEERVRRLHRIAGECGVMVDCHSGDDLKPATRRVIGRATQGRTHFKISPSLQVMFGEVLSDFHPREFRCWWTDTMDYARRMAAADRVRITGPGTDLSFSLRGMPARPCHGQRNIPDGEVYTAPVRDSVEGTICFNAASRYEGTVFERIELEFRAGRVERADGSGATAALAAVLD
jgi:hypothetical protein